MMFKGVSDVQARLEGTGYIPSREISTIIYLAQEAQKPVLVEGPAGVGKTELAKGVAACLGREMIRLQCYEGLDESKALYEWAYAKQLLYTQMLKEKIGEVVSGTADLAGAVEAIAGHEDAFFSDRFLQTRPLLAAISAEHPVVLLVDEVDKSDPEFEAFLLELLSDFQVTIPELGTIRARTRPFVFLTSNNYRDMSDALKRRCIHLYIDYPDMATEREIVRKKLPDIREHLLDQVVATVAAVRELDLKKRPCISETLDWAKSLMILQRTEISPETLDQTLNTLCKHKADYAVVRSRLRELVRAVDRD